MDIIELASSSTLTLIIRNSKILVGGARWCCFGNGKTIAAGMDITLQAGTSANQPSKRSRWQSYVDDALMKTGQVSKAAIHALDGARWASSPDFKVHIVDQLSVRIR